MRAAISSANVNSNFWTRAISGSGFGGLNRRGQFGASQFGNFQNAFEAAQLDNPALNVRDFLQKSGAMDALRQTYAALSPTQRGANVPTKTSVIRWG